MSESPNKKRHREQQFQQRLNQMVKSIKNKEEVCLQIIDYLQQILNNREQIQRLFFLQDEITKHTIFLQKVNDKMELCKNKQKDILTLFGSVFSFGQVQKNLIKRVSARALEQFQSFNEKVQKYSHFQKQISLHYKLIKPKFIRLINNIEKSDSTSINLSHLFHQFFQYLDKKFSDQSKKLSQVIELIQNGDLQRIQQPFICQHCKQVQASLQIKNQHHKSNYTKKVSKDPQNFQSNQHHEANFFFKQKEKINEKLKVMRLQAKTKQIVRKKKTKFANKHYNLYQSAMDIHKGYFVEELSFLDDRQHTQKIMTQMSQRNKHNQCFIKEFISVCSQKNMKQKTKSYFHLYPSTLQNYIETQPQQFKHKGHKTNSIQIPVQEYSIYWNKEEQNQDNNQLSSPNYGYDHIQEMEQRSEIKSFRITNPSKKSVIPTPKSNPNLFSIKQGTQQFNFVKINMKNAVPQRGRLPDISNRQFSIDDKRRSVRIMDKQQNFISANSNLIIIKTNLKKPQFDGKKGENKKKTQNNRKSEDKKLKRQQSINKLMIQKIGKHSTKALQINYNTHINKKINKLYEVSVNREDIRMQ